jgi:catechol 2,3-dioxygenase-like lactoylglutathione lyase family enzyme
MARIRHIAIYSDNPEKEASFYVRAFELKEVRRSPSGSVFLSDGYINLALLKSKGDAEVKGLHHFGFQVENLESTQERLRQIKPDIEIILPHDSVTFAEYKLKDPDGNTFDMSEKGWAV